MGVERWLEIASVLPSTACSTFLSIGFALQGVTSSGHASAVMEQIKREKCRADTTELGLVAREMQVR